MIIISLFIWIVTKARERDFSKSKKGISCWLILIEIIRIREKFLNQIEGVLGFSGFQKKRKGKVNRFNLFSREREREKYKYSEESSKRNFFFDSLDTFLFLFSSSPRQKFS